MMRWNYRACFSGYCVGLRYNAGSCKTDIADLRSGRACIYAASPRTPGSWARRRRLWAVLPTASDRLGIERAPPFFGDDESRMIVWYSAISVDILPLLLSRQGGGAPGATIKRIIEGSVGQNVYGAMGQSEEMFCSKPTMAPSRGLRGR